jgi:hypothetical protein
VLLLNGSQPPKFTLAQLKDWQDATHDHQPFIVVFIRGRDKVKSSEIRKTAVN